MMCLAPLPCIHLVTRDASAWGEVVLLASGLHFGFRVWRDADSFLSELDPDTTGAILVELAGAGPELALLDRLGSLGVDLPVIVLSRDATVDLCRQAFKAGATASMQVDQASDATLATHYAEFRHSTLIVGALEAEVLLPGREGADCWLHLTAAPLRDAQGHLTGAIETVQDVAPILECNKALQNEDDRGWSPGRELRRAATIPDIVILERRPGRRCINPK